MKILIPNAAIRDTLISNLSDRLGNLAEDGAEDSPDAEDITMLLTSLDVMEGFPCVLNCSGSAYALLEQEDMKLTEVEPNEERTKKMITGATISVSGVINSGDDLQSKTPNISLEINGVSVLLTWDEAREVADALIEVADVLECG